jgi:hypothetical protein
VSVNLWQCVTNWIYYTAVLTFSPNDCPANIHEIQDVDRSGEVTCDVTDVVRVHSPMSRHHLVWLIYFAEVPLFPPRSSSTSTHLPHLGRTR